VGLVRYDTVVVEGRTGRAAALRLLYSGTGMRNGRDECRDWALLAQQESFLLSVVRQVFGWPVIIVGALAGVVCDCFSVRIYSSTVCVGWTYYNARGFSSGRGVFLELTFLP